MAGVGSSGNAHWKRDFVPLPRWHAWLLALLLVPISPLMAMTADLAEAEALYRSGKYAECAELAGAEIEARSWREPWRLWKIQAEMAQGKYAEALASLEEAIGKYPSSVPLNLLAREVYLYNGLQPEATAALETIDEQVIRAPGRFTNAESRIALGRYYLIRAADAKRVLEKCYDFARNQRPEYVEGWLATAELALEKHDDKLAADTLAKAPESAAADPRFHYLRARAFASSDSEQAEKALAEALRINPRHVDSLLLQIDNLVDGEQYDDAREILKQVFAVNPREPRAWAFEAVLAHLRNDAAAETAARDEGLAHWKQNPEVDSLIGRKLSQKYRFAEGSEYQRRALAMDSYYMPARVQLSQDLLRLGQEDEGWKIAREVFAIDGYNVATFNLITLHDHLAGFRTLTGDGFVLRMEERESELYGQRALDLLQLAKAELGAKYGVEAPNPVLVEIFPQQKDFAVRTFGMPGVDGFLGVCFGKVITANSPASQGDSPSNWEAVLWHEFCHVVTLAKTRNKMPRWLSEGISVYEETQKNPGWGQAINVTYREKLLDETLTPLSELSSAFLTPKSALDLQFAYFESYLAVKYLVEKHGQDALNGTLDDLGAGLQINDALARHTQTSLEQLDGEFAEYARQYAASVAPKATWETPEFAPNASPAEVLTWVETHPANVPGLVQLCRELMRAKQWSEAKPRLEKLRELFPELIGPTSPYAMLATVHRELGETEAEQAVLEAWAARDGDALPAYLRLTELAEARGDWEAVAENARRAVAVNPLTANVHRALARSAEQLGERGEAIAAYRALVILDTTDPAEQHYRLAKLLRDDGQREAARREALKSLEEAPRYRAAHALLLELTNLQEGATP